MSRKVLKTLLMVSGGGCRIILCLERISLATSPKSPKSCQCNKIATTIIRQEPPITKMLNPPRDLFIFHASDKELTKRWNEPSRTIKLSQGGWSYNIYL